MTYFTTPLPHYRVVELNLCTEGKHICKPVVGGGSFGWSRSRFEVILQLFLEILATSTS